MYLQLVEKHGTARKWVACPICRKPKAFHGDEEKQNVNRALCEALQIIDQQKKALLQQQQHINSEEQEEKQVAVLLVKKEEQDIQEIVGKKRCTDHAGAANNTTTEIPSVNQEQTSRLPISDESRNASSNKPIVGKEKKMEEQSYHEDKDKNDYLDTLLQEAIDAVNRRSFGGHAGRHRQVQQEIMLLSSGEESDNDFSSSERVLVDAVQQFQHEMVSNDEESENSYSTPSAQGEHHVAAVITQARRRKTR